MTKLQYFQSTISPQPPKHAKLQGVPPCFTYFINRRSNFSQYNRSTLSGYSGLSQKKAGEEEKQAIANAMNRYLDVVGIQLGDLSLSSTDDGGKEASGKVSFFGFDQIGLKASMTADRKIKSISTSFPEAATITPDKLIKFFRGAPGFFSAEVIPLANRDIHKRFIHRI